jgi:hypothetical protein
MREITKLLNEDNNSRGRTRTKDLEIRIWTANHPHRDVEYCAMSKGEMRGRITNVYILDEMFVKPTGILFLVERYYTLFWDVTPCSLVKMYQRFGGKYCLDLQVEE